MRWAKKDQTKAGSRPKARHTGCSLTGSHNTAKCKYYMRNHMEPPSGVSVQELLVLPVVRGQWATTEQCELEPWASVSSWALGMLLLVLFWVSQLGAGFGNPSNILCRNRWFLLVRLRHFPFLINMAAPQEHGACLGISIPFRTERQKSLFPFSNKTLGHLPCSNYCN